MYMTNPSLAPKGLRMKIQSMLTYRPVIIIMLIDVILIFHFQQNE